VELYLHSSITPSRRGAQFKRAIVLLFFTYECKTWFVTVREDKFGVFENRSQGETA
jgi:hypothetical protein